MKNKKTILIHSNFCRAFTGFGKNSKNILRYLYSTNKYNIVEAANGCDNRDPNLKKLPWNCFGTLPLNVDPSSMSLERQRAAGYGAEGIDNIIKEVKPDVYLGVEDIWAFQDFHKKPWWNKVNCMIWTTLDSLPILKQAIEYAPKIKHYYVWASFAEKALKEIGYNHVKTLRGSVDTHCFSRLPDEERSRLRSISNIDQDSFIIGFVFRNQLRKSVPNILDGFKIFKTKNPNVKAKLLLHTHWSEGWDIAEFIKEKSIDPQDILTTYFCKQCRSYEVRSFSGQEQNCKRCGSEKSVSTTNVSHGVSEKQLNEVYNLMDLYCHPFTSGGQEIPIQEAKLTELITLVTDYSCGEDNCTPDSGGIPLKWNEYREPGTQFIKASTDPQSIANEIDFVFNMPKDEKIQMEKKSRQWAIDNFSIEVIGKKLEEIIDAMPEIDYDFTTSKVTFNESYKPIENLSKEDLIISLHKECVNEDVDKNSDSFKFWNQKLSTNEVSPENIINHFNSLAKNFNLQNNQVEFSSLFTEEDEGKRIAIVIPQSETDVFLINSLLKNLKKQYKNHNIYIFTQENYFQYIEDNPFVHKIFKYADILENVLFMEGAGDHKGYFDMTFYPATTTQKNICYIHNGSNKNQFSLSE